MNPIQGLQVPNTSLGGMTASPGQETHVGSDTSCELKRDFKSHNEFMSWIGDTQKRFGFIIATKRSAALKDSPIDEITSEPLFPFASLSYICSECKKGNIPCKLLIK
jgi:hypothetical protein